MVMMFDRPSFAPGGKIGIGIRLSSRNIVKDIDMNIDIVVSRLIFIVSYFLIFVFVLT